MGEPVEAEASVEMGQKGITFNVSIVALGTAIFAAIAWVYSQVRDVEAQVHAVREDLVEIRTAMHALEKSSDKLQGDLDKIAPRSLVTPSGEAPYRVPLPSGNDGGPAP